jgi:hypothetical protein
MRLRPLKTSGKRVISGAASTTPVGPAEVVRRYEITVEREFVSVHSETAPAFAALCEVCAHEVTMLAPEEAAEVAGVTVRAVYRWVEEKRVHFIEPDSGRVFVCAESLQALLRSNQLSRGELR